MTKLIPISGQIIYLAKPVTETDMTIHTIGKFKKTSTGTGIIGPQIIDVSPWTISDERMYVDVTAEPVVIEDNSATGTASVYEYTIITRGIHSDNTATPPDKYSLENQKTHKYGAAVLIPVSVEYFHQYNADFVAATNNRSVQVQCYDAGTAVTVGDDRGRIIIPASFDGVTISSVRGILFTAGATGATTVQLHNITTGNDILSTPVTFSDTDASGAGVIDAALAEVSTDDVLRIDIDTVTTTKPKGMIILIEFVS